MRFRQDSSYRRVGSLVLAGSPLRMFRLSPGGLRVVEAIERGEEPAEGHERLTDRLIDAGAVHPLHEAGPFTASDVTAVSPVLNATAAAVPDVRTTIVVDDASEPPVEVTTGVTVLRLARNCGPGPARNVGLQRVTTDLVAFVDSDVRCPDGWLEPLLVHFDDARVALVAPRVVASGGSASTLGAYERSNGPLDLGDEAARIDAGTRVSYVPAAAIVCRVDAVRSIGGFDPTLRFGEDVDLVWRLRQAGWRCRYEPASSVSHEPRPTLREWARQRVGYGSSAAPLAVRHPGALAPLRMSGWSAGVWALVALRRPLLALGLAGWTCRALQRKLTDLPAQEAWRLAGLGHLFAGRQVASAITRTWWPLALVAGLLFPRLRPALVAAAVVPALLDARSPDVTVDPVRYTLLRIADDAAYGAGVWRGVVRQRSAAALRPSFTNWPPRRAGG